MNEVKRYDGKVGHSPDGGYVSYQDYAALKDSAMDYAYRWGKAQDDIKKAHMLHSMQKEEIASLKEQLTATTNSLTNAQEALKSAGIEADTVQAGVMELVDKLRIKQNHIQLRDNYIEELEQRAEAAEAKADNLNNGWLNAISERDDARAKLAELEKQEPVAWCNENDLKLMVNKRMIGGMMTVRYHGERPLFTRPAPAIDLNAVRADAVEDVAKRLYGQGYNFEVLTRFAAQLRAGNAGKDGV